MNLALVDNNESHLSAAHRALQSSPLQTEIYQIDVSQLSEWKTLHATVMKKFPRIDFLMLNAGIGAKGGWDDSDYFSKIFATNLFGVTNGINTFVSDIRRERGAKEGPSAIVITGSKQGITNPPGNAAYNASKSAIKTLAEHLDYDLRDTDTSVHLLVPGWTFTGLSGNAGPGEEEAMLEKKPKGAWLPRQVAEYLEQKLHEGSFWAICPDNDVTEDMDRKRVMWTAGDLVQGRKPCSRWREEYQEEATEFMKNYEI